MHGVMQMHDKEQLQHDRVLELEANLPVFCLQDHPCMYFRSSDRSWVIVLNLARPLIWNYKDKVEKMKVLPLSKCLLKPEKL